MTERDLLARLDRIEASIAELRAPARPLHRPPPTVPGAWLAAVPVDFDERGRALSGSRIVFVTGRDCTPLVRRGESWLHHQTAPGEFYAPAWADPRIEADPSGFIPGTNLRIVPACEAPGQVFGFEPGPVISLAAIVEISRRRKAAIDARAAAQAAGSA